MNKNKQKYISVQQDSFRFESFNRLESVPYPEQTNTINHQARINEICLSAAQNKTSWQRIKSIYYKIEIITFIFGFLLSFFCLTSFSYVLYYTIFGTLLSFIPDRQIFQFPFLYLVIESTSLFLDLIKLVSIIEIAKIFNSKSQTNYKDDKSVLYETIINLDLRCLIRDKLKAIQTFLYKLEIVINSYFLVFVIAVKYALAIYLSIQIGSILDIKNTTLYTVNTTLYCNESIDSNDCLNLIQTDLKTYFIIFILFLYITASLKFLTQTILFINFKYCLCFCIIKKLNDEELDLINEYQDCKDEIFKESLNIKIQESQEYYANKFFDLNTLSRSGYKSDYVNTNEHKYLNEEDTHRYLNEDEINAIGLIDEATKNEK